MHGPSSCHLGDVSSNLNPALLKWMTNCPVVGQMLFKDIIGVKNKTIIDNGTCPKTNDTRAIYLSSCFFTIPFQIEWMNAANTTAINTVDDINKLLSEQMMG